MAALSIATDLGMGQPLESALCSCVIAVRFGEALRLDDKVLHDVYYQALLRYIGCNAETDVMAALFGDELALRGDFAGLDAGRPPDVLGVAMRYMRQAQAGVPPYRAAAFIARGLLTLPRLMSDSFAGHCEVAQRLADRLGFGRSLIDCLGQVYERWDGKGLPRKLKGDQVALPVQVVSLAQDAVFWHRVGGADAAVATIRKRSGGAYQPGLAQRFCDAASTLLEGLDEEPTWESVLALDPVRSNVLTEDAFDRACAALADFGDIKSAYTIGHSTGVAALAAGAGVRYGLPSAEVTLARRAGLLHDIGRVGVSAGIWGKQASLSEREWEQVRLHTYYTDRVLARPETLARIGAVASRHHERVDGTGYHRGLSAQMLSPTTSILAAADAYQAMTEPRAYRPAMSADRAAEQLRGDAKAGRLDADAVNAILAEAGHAVPRSRRQRPAGLSDRELEVLRLISRGLSNRDMAAQLVISQDTVKHHIQHIYDKIGVSTRAGATLFAMENRLL
jgi:HD-GYP domain-containing protein (c-di-GMP phosphodiesterase class II)